MASITPESTAAPSALAEFTLFPKLPIELRLKIFREALPTGPRGMRWVKVNFEKPKVTSEVDDVVDRIVFEFRLPGHEHDVFVKDVGLLGACSESRDVYLKFFDRSLPGEGIGLIRFSKQDVIYVANLWQILDYMPEHGHIVEAIRCDNLAGPTSCFQESQPDVPNPTHIRCLCCWGGVKLIGPVWDGSFGTTETPAKKWEAHMPEAFKDVGESKAILEKGVGLLFKENLRDMKLCVWDRDGNYLLVEGEKAAEENSSTA